MKTMFIQAQPKPWIKASRRSLLTIATTGGIILLLAGCVGIRANDITSSAKNALTVPKGSADSGEKTVLLSGKRPLRVLTMNILMYDELYYDARQPLLRKGILKLDPDLICFQEARYDGKQHQVTKLLEGFGYHVLHQFDYKRGKDPGGNCIASRWPMELVEMLKLPATQGPNPDSDFEVAMAVRVHVPPPVGPMLLVNVVTAWQQFREYDREQQVVAMAKMIQRHADPKGFPSIIAGDFTSAPDTSCIRFLKGRQSLDGMSVHYLDAWEEGGDGSAGYTWSYRNDIQRQLTETALRQRHHARRVDYIFLDSFRADEKFAMIRDCRVVLNEPQGGIWPSDHFGVYAEIDVVPYR